jgi:hypothetical protein
MWSSTVNIVCETGVILQSAVSRADFADPGATQSVTVGNFGALSVWVGVVSKLAVSFVGASDGAAGTEHQPVLWTIGPLLMTPQRIGEDLSLQEFESQFEALDCGLAGFVEFTVHVGFAHDDVARSVRAAADRVSIRTGDPDRPHEVDLRETGAH